MALEMAVEQAALTRLRPVLMTTLVAALALYADGYEHWHECRSAKAVGDSCHRWGDQRHGNVAASAVHRSTPVMITLRASTHCMTTAVVGAMSMECPRRNARYVLVR